MKSEMTTEIPNFDCLKFKWALGPLKKRETRMRQDQNHEYVRKDCMLMSENGHGHSWSWWQRKEENPVYLGEIAEEESVGKWEPSHHQEDDANDDTDLRTWYDRFDCKLIFVYRFDAFYLCLLVRSFTPIRIPHMSCALMHEKSQV